MSQWKDIKKCYHEEVAYTESLWTPEKQNEDVHKLQTTPLGEAEIQGSPINIESEL